MEETILLDNKLNKCSLILLDKYKVVKQIKKTNSSIIYLCENIELNNKVIVKKIDLQLKLLGENEIDILSRINHRQIPHIIETKRINDYIYIVETYIDGITLKEKIRQCNNKIGEELLISYFMQLLELLKYLHTLKPYSILHLDIKPENIMVDNFNNLFLLDFGISKISYKDNCIKAATVKYASLEQINQNLDIDKRADIYSLGIMMYRIISNNYTSNINIKDIKNNTCLYNVIRKMCSDKRKYRYEDVTSIIKDIEYYKSKYTYKVDKKIILFYGLSSSGKTSIISGLSCLCAEKNIKICIISKSEDIKSFFYNIKKVKAYETNVGINYTEYCVNKNINIIILNNLQPSSIVRFANNKISDFDVVFLDFNILDGQALAEYISEKVFVFNQERKEFNKLINYIKDTDSAKWSTNNIFVINRFVGGENEKERIFSILDRILKILVKKNINNELFAIGNIDRLSYIKNMYEGKEIYKNNIDIKNDFMCLLNRLCNRKREKGVFNNIKRWLKYEFFKKV